MVITASESVLVIAVMLDLEVLQPIPVAVIPFRLQLF
jgi:hypothetical protein